MLESSIEETDFLNKLQSHTLSSGRMSCFFDQSLPSDVPEFMTLIRRVMNYEDLSEIDTSTALRFCLDKDIPTYLKAAFLKPNDSRGIFARKSYDLTAFGILCLVKRSLFLFLLILPVLRWI